MLLKKINLVIMSTVLSTVFAAKLPELKNPCTGPYALINLTNRGSNADSPCVVPAGQLETELGYQYQSLRPGLGDLQSFPISALRFGLKSNNELLLFPPFQYQQSVFPYSGISTTGFGAKHFFGYNEKWVVAAEGQLLFPGGSAAFGSQGFEAVINAIANYSLSSTFTLSMMLGVSTATEPVFYGGGRFTSFNPDAELIYAPHPWLNFFAEVYGQTATGYGVGSGFNFDAGVLYLPFPAVVLDMELGQQLSGALGNFGQFISGGISILFS